MELRPDNEHEPYFFSYAIFRCFLYYVRNDLIYSSSLASLKNHSLFVYLCHSGLSGIWSNHCICYSDSWFTNDFVVIVQSHAKSTSFILKVEWYRAFQMLKQNNRVMLLKIMNFNRKTHTHIHVQFWAAIHWFMILVFFFAFTMHISTDRMNWYDWKLSVRIIKSTKIQRFEILRWIWCNRVGGGTRQCQ